MLLCTCWKKLSDQLALINFPFYCLLAFISLVQASVTKKHLFSRQTLRRKDTIRLVVLLFLAWLKEHSSNKRQQSAQKFDQSLV